jgi:hypothetical protein
MTEDDIITFVSGLPGVDVLTASQQGGAPEIAWGDSFFYYDPRRDIPADKRVPFATIVTKDYPGFDEASQVDRPGVFRVNVNVGRALFEELFGYPPAAQAEHQGDHDYAALDTLVPHPLYAVQGWASIVSPGDATGRQLPSLLTAAHARAVRRHR